MSVYYNGTDIPHDADGTPMREIAWIPGYMSCTLWIREDGKYFHEAEDSGIRSDSISGLIEELLCNLDEMYKKDSPAHLHLQYAECWRDFCEQIGFLRLVKKHYGDKPNPPELINIWDLNK